MYKVLWVDDDESIVASTQQIADDYDIELVHFTNWEDAEPNFRANFQEYSAIILDANCKIKRDDVEQGEFIPVVKDIISRICGEKRKFIPSYIFSAGTMEGFSYMIKGPQYQHSFYEEEYGRLLYYKDAPDDSDQASTKMFENIKRIAKDKSLNTVMYRHRDVFGCIGKDRYIDSKARRLMLKMLSALYYPEENIYFEYEGNPLRKVMEYVFRAANKVGLLPKECIEKDDQINLLESNRYMSGMNTKHSHIRYGEEGKDTIFPEYLGHITKAIIEFGSIDSHTNETSPYTIDDKDLTLTDNEKELFFSYVLQLCHIIKFFAKFVEQHSDVEENKSMKRVLNANYVSPSDYDGYEGIIERDSDGNCYCGKCLLSYKYASDKVGKLVKLCQVKENEKSTKSLYPLWAQFQIINK